MNINDVDNVIEYPEDIMKAIFDKQLELTVKYLPIEKKNGLLLTDEIPVNLDCRLGQARLKAFAWYATEELVEAKDAENDNEHFLEELIDALHFIVELSILAGYEYRNIDFYYENQRSATDVYPLIHNIGMAMHKLKSKAWKQTHQLTDRNRFYACIEEVFKSFFGLMHFHDITAKDVYNLYFKKSSVNAFRIRSNY